jgi:thiol-disulfide isomerase/thioredoxin
MMKLFPHGVVILVCAASSAFAAAPAADTSSAISGRVLDGGKAVAGAKVVLYEYLQDRLCVGPLKSVTTSADGTYRFDRLKGTGYLVKATVSNSVPNSMPGFAPGLRLQNLDDGQQATLNIRLHKAARLTVRVRSRDGKPLAGATLREITMEGPNGRVWLHENVLKMIDLAPAPSDKAGLLRLPPLPAGDVAVLSVDHPDFAPIELKDVRIEDATVDASMPACVKLAFHIHPPGVISKVYVDLRHEPFNHPSTTFRWIPVRPDGIATLTVEPGSYESLFLKHPDYLISPMLDMDYPNWKSFIEFSGPRQTVNFFLHRKVTIRGRVVSGLTGSPFANKWVSAKIPNSSTDRNKHIRQKWLNGDWAQTNAKGEFQLQVAAGKFHITLQERGYTSSVDDTDFEAADDGSTVVPEIRVFPAPTIIGRVLRPDGTPAAHTVVRLRGQRLAFVQPVLTDSQGHFELQVPFIPKDAETSRNICNHPLVAFDAYEPLAARVDLRLDQPQTLANITLQLHAERYEDQLREIDGDLSAWGRRDLSTAALRAAAKEHLRGQRPPELTGARWLNVPAPQSTTQSTTLLGTFAGKYVLLDFWTTWCGPCHGDFPSLQLAQALYADKGLIVVGIHDNSVPPALIAQQVKEQKLTFPIAIDVPDGHLVQAYSKLGLIEGYPGYLLLSPEGKVLDADSCLPGPALRRFKLELIRAAIMSKRKDKGGRMKDEQK